MAKSFGGKAAFWAHHRWGGKMGQDEDFALFDAGWVADGESAVLKNIDSIRQTFQSIKVLFGHASTSARIAKIEQNIWIRSLWQSATPSEGRLAYSDKQSGSVKTGPFVQRIQATQKDRGGCSSVYFALDAKPLVRQFRWCSEFTDDEKPAQSEQNYWHSANLQDINRLWLATIIFNLAKCTIDDIPRNKVVKNEGSCNDY